MKGKRKLSQLWKRRKHPIKYDEYGRSARSRAFQAFDERRRPEDVVREIEISLDTAKHYFWEWQHRPVQFDTKYAFLKKETIKRPELRQRMITECASNLNMSEDEVTSWLQKPWGLHQVMTGKLLEEAEYRQAVNNMTRLMAADRLLRHLDSLNFTHEEQARLLLDAIFEASKRRKNKRGAN